MAYHPSILSAQHAPTAETAQTTDASASVTARPVHQSNNAQSLNTALKNGELNITISELLGCDYVFIKHLANSPFMHEGHITRTITQLISLLELKPAQKIFIGAYENESGAECFIRLNCEWQGSTATQVICKAITDEEQIDFMRMIFDCSSPYEHEAL